MEKDTTEKYIELLKQEGANEAVKISSKSVVTAAWAIYKCKYGCPGYGKSFCCPPQTPTWKETREILDCYEYGILFSSQKMDAIMPIALKVTKELFLDGYYKALAFSAGPCHKCEQCGLDHCKYPGQALPSMEACGIDVFATVRDNGLEIATLRDKEATTNCYGLIMIE